MPHDMANPAYELVEQHLHLETMLEHLRDSVNADVKPSSFVAELKHVRDRLRSHFAFEEQDGYLHEALANAEHLQSASVRLLQDHRSPLQQFDRLIEGTERSSSDLHVSADLVRELDTLLQRLREHEHRENELLQRALSEAINAID
jgi:hypothetical protein